MPGLLVAPSPEIMERFKWRTRDHISRVAANLHRVAQVFDAHSEELSGRAKVHDASKFGPVERIAYAWLTEFHRCRRSGEEFAYPEGVQAHVERAICHHVTSNRHHPEYHSDPNDMSEVDLIEMVCDWSAMAQELGQDGSSARSWADKTIGTRILFNAENTALVYRIIAELRV